MLVTTTEMYLRVFSQKQVVADFLRDILPAQADCRFDADSAWCDEHLSRALQSQLGVSMLAWRTAQEREPSTLVFVLDPFRGVDEGAGDFVENIVCQIRACFGGSGCGASAVSTEQVTGILHIVFVFAGCQVRDGVPVDVATQPRLDMIQGRSGPKRWVSAGAAGVIHRPGVSIVDEDRMVLPPDYAAAVQRMGFEAPQDLPGLEGLPPCGRLVLALIARQAQHQMEADRAALFHALAALVRRSLSKNQHFRVDLPTDASLPEIMEHLSSLSRGRAALGQTIQPQSRPATNAGEDPLS